MNKTVILFFVAGFSVCCISPIAISQTRNISELTFENAPKAIKKLCKKGRVRVWKYDNPEKIIYEFSIPKEGVISLAGKYDYRNADGKNIGYANYSDMELRLLDGSRAFCSFNGKACPKPIKVLCSFRRKN